MNSLGLFRTESAGMDAMDGPPIAKINAVVQGPLIDVLIGNVPAFANLSRDRAYDLVMKTPEVADGCFKLFRSRPELFANVLKGPDGRPIATDDDMLSCGRTLAQVISLIVKNMARRYFRNKLDGGVARDKKPQSPIDKVRELVGLSTPPQVKTLPAAPSAAESLYRAMRNYLLYEWQVRLIPKYSTLSVAFVTAAGPQLMSLREPDEIDALMTARQAKEKPKSSGIVGDFVPSVPGVPTFYPAPGERAE